MEAQRDKEIKEAMSRSLTEGVAKIQEYLDKEQNAELNIAITGESGAGKSSFVNAFRGIRNNAEGAAKAGVTQTTMEVKAYPHPSFTNIILWDLPGIGTTTFPAAKYLEHVGFEKFDFFIIISHSRFRENDAKLAKEIQKMGKKFYFVRSQIDIALSNAENDCQGAFNEEKTLADMRKDCIKGLSEQGFETPQVFLVSARDINMFDFYQLQNILEKELPEHKRFALLMAMPNINLEIIEKKRKAFQDKIKYAGGLSSVVAAIPVPGISLYVDVALLVTRVNLYKVAFGLDKPSLERLSATTRVPLEDLQAVIQSPLCLEPVSKELIIGQLGRFGLAFTTLLAIEEGSRFFPLLGIPVAVVSSYLGTYMALDIFLKTIAEDAQRVFRKALGLNTSV